MTSISQGRVSVVIPVHNRSRMIIEAIDSIRAQTWTDWEVVVADDASTDDTVAVVKELAATEPRIRIVELPPPNGGPGVAREAGRLVASGEYIQYLDSDDLLLPDKFEKQVELLRRCPEADIAYGWTMVRAADGSLNERPCKSTGERHLSLFPKLLIDRWWFTSTPLYRRSLVDRIGAWPTIRWGQDWAYDAKAAALGARLVSLDAYVSVHREHGGARQTGVFDWYSGERLQAYHDLQVVMLESAIAAGVATGIAEMRHFARLQFKIARSFAAEGRSDMAREAYALAARAYGLPHEVPRDMRWYETLSNLFGWKFVGRLAVLRDRRPWTRLPA